MGGSGRAQYHVRMWLVMPSYGMVLLYLVRSDHKGTSGSSTLGVVHQRAWPRPATKAGVITFNITGGSGIGCQMWMKKRMLCPLAQTSGVVGG